MHLKEDQFICGKLSDVPFLNATRPIPGSSGGYVCPNGSKPCLLNAAPEITFCIDENSDRTEKCPYTDIRLLTNEDPLGQDGNHPEYQKVDLGHGILLVSKTVERMPPTSFKLGLQPCEDV